jgi:hypothetical protein
MKKSVLALVIVLIMPLAFGETSTPTPQTTASGTVTDYTPGKRIIVRSERSEDRNPVSFVLDKTVHFVNKAGRKIDEHIIRPGKRVIVHYTREGERRIAHRVEVNED